MRGYSSYIAVGLSSGSGISLLRAIFNLAVAFRSGDRPPSDPFMSFVPFMLFMFTALRKACHRRNPVNDRESSDDSRPLRRMLADAPSGQHRSDG